MPDDLHIVRWSDDLALMTALNGDPEQMAYVGGAETAEKIADRNAQCARDPHQFRIVDAASGAGVGWVGFWPTESHGTPIYEIGWSVLRAFQGRGFATRATALMLEVARAVPDRPERAVHAYPGVDNAPSNAVCRKLSFTLIEADKTLEYPPGSMMVVNDWRLAL